MEKWFYSSFRETLDELLRKYILKGGEINFILQALVTALITLILLFFLNWTFVLVVNALSAPFNDFIAGRVENKYCLNEKIESRLEVHFSFSKIVKTFINEAKKIIFILLIALFNLIIGLIPILAPIAILLTVILFVIGFLDYSWSRNNYTFKECIKDLFGNFFTYLVSGFFLMSLMSVPIVNLFLLPFNLVFFTLLWCRNNLNKSI
ncbi:MAG: EI24 domain-containing protein [Bacteriovoracaceae bacterium]